MRLQDCPDPVGRKLWLITVPSAYRRELVEARRKVPLTADVGVCVDFERAGILLANDMLAVKLESGDAAGDTVWLPTYCFRLLTEGSATT
jgi:hypothetical protein